MKPSNNQLAKHFGKIMSRVPLNIKLENDDFGFLVLMAICDMNGSNIIGSEIFHKGQRIGHQLNYRFDGDVLSFAYISSLQNKLVSSTIRIV